MIKPAFVFALGISVLGGCPLLDVEVDVPEVCVTYRDLQVEGIPVPTDETVTVHNSFAVDDLSAFHQITELDAQAAFVRADLFARAGITSFDFVDAAKISISAPDSSLPPLVLYQCDGDCVASDGSLDMTPDTQHDALDYLKGESLVIDIEMTGRLPHDRWAMDIDVCFQASAHYSY